MTTSTVMKKLSIAFLGATAASTIVTTVTPANAAITTFSDRTLFTNATQSLQNIDFENLAPSGSFTDYGVSGLTQLGANFVGSSNYLFVVDPLYSPDFYDWGSGAVLLGNDNGSISVNLPTGINAVGSDIMSIIDYASPFVITLSTGESFNINSLNYPNRGFFGLISDTAISSISFRATNGYTELDNFTFGTASVPEPTFTFSLLALGVVGAGSALKRKKQQKATIKA